MAEKKDTRTAQQILAIESDNSNVLVSASAGSGKTFVMMERIKRLVLERQVDIDKILCVTFTVLAAKEMKQKLADTITKALKTASGKEREKLQKQLELLPTASISTMHAFCKNILTEFFYEVGLDPAFTLLDDKDRKLIVNRAIDRLFEDLYESEDEDLKVILPYLFKKRKDAFLKEKIVDIYGALISEANPKEILEKGEFYYTDEGVDFIAQAFYKEFKGKIEAYLDLMPEYLQKSEYYPKLHKFVLTLRDSMALLIKPNSEFFSCEYENLYNRAKTTSFRMPSKSKEEDVFEEEVRLEVDAIKEKAKEIIKEIQANYLDLEEQRKTAQKLRPVYNALKNIVLKFMEYFEREKRAENAVDFSDLEHLTLKLLQKDDVKEEIASRYLYIFTDEYQDTSGVQEALLTAISKNNLFMVGDVKQSIYDFRGCNPDIFANKYKRFKEDPSLGIVIDLDKNFRSSATVLNAVNSVFSCVMTEKCGKVNYKNNPMEVGANYPQNEGEVGLYVGKQQVLEAGSDLPEGIYSVVNHLEFIKNNPKRAGLEEAKIMVDFVNGLLGKDYYDIKTNQYKKLQEGDITILLRDANADADKFAVEFARAGIAVNAPSKDSIANYAEIAQAIDLLKLIDCYNQDIPLASVLKSEVGGFTDAELLQIRKAFPKGTFVEAVDAYACKDDEIALKINAFNEYFKGIRLLADFMPCGELLAKIVREKGIDLKLISARHGENKIARLNKFIEVANASKQTVGEFLNGLEGLLEKLTLALPSNNAVKIMSIHASKGLEFPVVILARANKDFNEKSLEGDFLVDRYLGVTIDDRDFATRMKRKTLFTKYVKYQKRKRLREEEMRLLYVAMTRAKNSLFIFGEFSKKETPNVATIHDSDVYGAGCYLKMLASCDMPVHAFDDVENSLKEEKTKQVLIGEANEESVLTIKQNLSYKYPFKQRSALSVKRSVTQASHYDEEEGTHYERSSIISEEVTKIGNAYHRFLELCDFTLSPEDAFNGVIGGLLMEEEYKSLVEKEKIFKILQMPVFNEIEGYTLYKEQPFTAFMPASIVENYTEETSEEVLVQGIIDLLAIKGDEAIIIDYKHSGVKDENTLINRYKKQLELYAIAVEKVLNKKVIKACLVNVNHCKIIEVKL